MHELSGRARRRGWAALLGTVPCLATAACASPGPRSSYVYVLTNPDGDNAVEAFRRDLQTGLLERIGRYPTFGKGDPYVAGYEQQAVVADSHRLYAVNPGSDTVSAFAIADDGGLQFRNQLPSGGRRPASLTLRNDLLYVANSGHAPTQSPDAASYKGFRLQPDGALSALACPVVPAASGTVGNTVSALVLNQDATMLAVAGLLPDRVETFMVDSAGCLQNRLQFPGNGGPYGANFTPPGAGAAQQFFVTLGRPENFPGERAPGVSSYQVGPGNQLTPGSTWSDPDPSDTGLRDPCWIVFTADAQRFWTSSFIPRTIHLFEVGAGGQLSRRSVYDPGDTAADLRTPPGPPFHVGSTDIALAPGGQFLYQLRAFSSPSGDIAVVPFLVVFAVTAAWDQSAGLRELQRLPLPSDLSTAGVTGLALVDR